MKRIAIFLASYLLANAVPAADLLAVYQRALQNDPQLREAEATRLAALEAKPQALSTLLPQLAGNGKISRERDTGSINQTQSLALPPCGPAIPAGEPCSPSGTPTVDCVRRDDLGPTFKMLARVSIIQQQLLQSWDVLATITPHDYSAFRNTLGKSSGFQSPQYRQLEFLIGNKNAELIKVFRNDPAAFETLERALRAPSLYDEVLRLLSRRGLDVPAQAIDRDFTQPYQASKQVAAAWLSVYHNSVKEWDLY